MASAEVIAKWEAERPDDFFVSARRYLILRGGEANRLALRLYNGTDGIVTGVRLSVRRAGGGKGETRCFEVEGLSAARSAEFSLPDLMIPSGWNAVECSIQKVYSGHYVYSCTNDTVQVGYRSKASLPRKGKKVPAAGPHKAENRSKRYALFAVFSAVGLFALALGISLLVLFFGGENAENGGDAAGQYVQVFGEESC